MYCIEISIPLRKHTHVAFKTTVQQCLDFNAQMIGCYPIDRLEDIKIQIFKHVGVERSETVTKDS